MRRQRLTNIFSYGSAFCVISQLIVIGVQEFAGLLISRRINDDPVTSALPLIADHRWKGRHFRKVATTGRSTMSEMVPGAGASNSRPAVLVL
jgi:hypothetical protein